MFFERGISICGKKGTSKEGTDDIKIFVSQTKSHKTPLQKTGTLCQGYTPEKMEGNEPGVKFPPVLLRSFRPRNIVNFVGVGSTGTVSLLLDAWRHSRRRESNQIST